MTNKSNPMRRSDDLLVRFREVDSATGICRKTLRTMSVELGMSQAAVVQLALRALHNQMHPIRESESGSAALPRRKKVSKIVPPLLPNSLLRKN